MKFIALVLFAALPFSVSAMADDTATPPASQIAISHAQSFPFTLSLDKVTKEQLADFIIKASSSTEAELANGTTCEESIQIDGSYVEDGALKGYLYINLNGYCQNSNETPLQAYQSTVDYLKSDLVAIPGLEVTWDVYEF